MQVEANNIGALNRANYEDTQPKITNTCEDQSIFVSEDVNSAAPETEGEEKEVSFSEGVGLIFKGIWNKIQGMINSVLQHPLETIATIGITAALIAAAPIVGISCATAGSIMALGFGAVAIGKTVGDVGETVKDYSEGRYDEVREDLEGIGGDTVDLALTLPFMPKAMKQVGRFAKYGTGSVGLNTELLSNISKSGSLKGARFELSKADTLINYDMLGNEMGLSVKPEIEFYNEEFAAGQNRRIASFEPTTGKIKVNEQILYGKNKASLRLQGDTTESVLRHELEHYRQFSDIARANGTEGLQNTLVDYHKSIYKNANGDLDIMTREKLNKIMEENPSYTFEEACDAYKEELRLLNEEAKKLSTNPESIDYTNFEAADKRTTEIFEQMERQDTAVNNATEKYLRDLEGKTKALEKLEKQGIDSETAENMIFGDKSAFNEKLYKDVIDSQGVLSPESSEAINAQKYAKDFANGNQVDPKTVEQLVDKYGITSYDQMFNTAKYRKFMLEAYKSKLVENEAYDAQGLFRKSVMRMRPNVITNGVFALSELASLFQNDDTDEQQA